MFEKNLTEIKNGIDVRRNLIEIKQAGARALKSEKLYDVSLFALLLKHEDPKVRKNAALIIGEAGEDRLVAELYEAYENENTMFVKSAYLTALAKLPYEQYLDDFRMRKTALETMDIADEDVKHISEELKALKALVGDDKPAVGHIFNNPENPVRVILSANPEAVELLLKEIPGAERMFLGVSVTTTDVKKLSNIRIYRDMYFAINDLKGCDKADLPKAIVMGNLMKLLDAMHGNSKAPYRFRLTAKDVDLADIGARVEALSKGRLINAPSDYEIEIKLLKSKEGHFGTLLKLHTWEDRRFAYRKETVATSMKLQDAALMVRLCEDYLKDKAQIIDPFCGVGTLLVERAKLMRPSHTYGTDTFGKAILAARENTKAAGMEFNYINRDFFDFTSDYVFDEIITQMPSLEVSEEDAFYKRFFEKCMDIMADDGIIIMCADRKNLVKKHLRLNKNFKLIREFVLNEKNETFVWVIGR